MISDAFTTSSVELFVKDGILLAITNGRTYTWDKIPTRIKSTIENLLHKDPQALELLREYSQSERLRIYAKCGFGGFNPTPDIDVCGTANLEHWDCNCSSCPLKDHFRNSLVVKNGILSSREIEVAKLIAQGFYGKEISGQLNISESTINTHKRHIFEKVGIGSNVELTKWAYQINLI